MNAPIIASSKQIADLLPRTHARLDAASAWLAGGEVLPASRPDVVSAARAHPIPIVAAGVSAYEDAKDAPDRAHAQIMTAIGLYWWGYHREAQVWLDDVEATTEADDLYRKWYMFLCQRVQQRKRDVNSKLIEIADALEATDDTTGAWQCRQDAALEWVYYDPQRAVELLKDSGAYLEAKGRVADVCLGKLRLILTYINVGAMDDIPALLADIEASLIPEEMPGLDCLTWMYRARYANGRGDLDDMLHCSDMAKVRSEALHHLYYKAHILLALSVRYSDQGEIEIAKEIDTQALALARELEWLFGISTATVQLGNYELWQGEYDAARQLYLDARTRFEALDETLFAATCNLNLGIVAYSQSAFSEALDLVERARQEYERLNSVNYLALAHHNLGKIYASYGLINEAIPQFETSIAILQKSGVTWQSVRSQTFLARILMDLPDEPDHGRAEELLRLSKMQAESKALHKDEVLVILAEADLAYRRDQYVRALEGYHQVVGRSKDMRQKELANEAMLGLAASHLRRAEADEAREVLAELDFEGLPAVFKWTYHLLQARLHLLAGDILAVKAQYQVAMYHLRQARMGIAKDDDRAHFVFRLQRSFAEAFEFAYQLNDVNLALQIAESVSGNGEYAHTDVEDSAGIEFNTFVAQLRQNLGDRYGEGWTILRYYYHLGRFFVFCITSENLTFMPVDERLSDDTMIRMCANPDESFRRRVYDRLDDMGILSGRSMRQTLYDAFIRPVMPDRLDPDHLLIIIPSWELHGLPFHALLDGDAPLIIKSEVAYGQSLTSLADALTRDRANSPLLQEPGVILAQSTFVSERYADLPHIQSEVEAIITQAQGDVMHLSPDDLDAVRLHDVVNQREPKPYYWLHIATHSAYDRRQTYSSGLVMGGDLISIEAIREWRTPVRLVTMSACQTASWRWLHGEIIVSLTSAFLKAGADTVIASQWDVYDETTAHMMAQFYQRLAAEDRPSRAMAAVQRKMHQAGISPYLWGTFGVYGIP